MNETAGYKQFHSICKSDVYKENCICHFLRFRLLLEIHMIFMTLFSSCKSLILQTCKSINL